MGIILRLFALLFFGALYHAEAEFLFGNFPENFKWGVTNSDEIDEDCKYTSVYTCQNS